MTIKNNTQPNPHRGQDMLITFEVQQCMQGFEGAFPLRIRYIPDREIVTDKDFKTWLDELSQEKWATPEEFINQLSDKFYDAVLPYFIDIQLEVPTTHGIIHRLESVKNQPQYKIPEYLLRLL